MIQSPGFVEQVNQGGGVGYTIIAMGIVGMLIALSRLLVLQIAGRRMARQLKSDQASDDNPLGRILAIYENEKTVAADVLGDRLG